jgi:hypothetical protein
MQNGFQMSPLERLVILHPDEAYSNIVSFSTREQGFDCNWGCKAGHYLASPSNCSACPAKPENTFWEIGIPSTPGSCKSKCGPGLYGHPMFFGVCLPCSELMAAVWKPNFDLPLHSQWSDDLGWCNVTAWSCLAGFSRIRVESETFCCPDSIPNSQPDPAAVPCGVMCRPGFFWDPLGYNCSACKQTLTPGNEWDVNCSMTFDCDRIYVRPANSRWPTILAPGNATSCVWSCDEGHVRTGADLCCSESVPGYGVAGREWAGATCSIQCQLGLFGVSPSGICKPCAQYLKDVYGLDFCRRCPTNVFISFSPPYSTFDYECQITILCTIIVRRI